MSDKSKAFTFIEILIILAILGFSSLILIPVMTSNVKGKNKLEDFFNENIKESYVLAKKNGKPVYISGFKGSPNLILPNGKSVKLPDGISILRIKIDDKDITGLKYYIGIYPQGICDYFELVMDNGRIIESVPLLMKVKLKS